MDEFKHSPITLYVNDVSFSPPLVFPHKSRITVIDIEITEEIAASIVDHLSGRLKEEPIAAIRFRLSGKLVIT